MLWPFIVCGHLHHFSGILVMLPISIVLSYSLLGSPHLVSLIQSFHLPFLRDHINSMVPKALKLLFQCKSQVCITPSGYTKTWLPLENSNNLGEHLRPLVPAWPLLWRSPEEYFILEIQSSWFFHKSSSFICLPFAWGLGPAHPKILTLIYWVW